MDPNFAFASRWRGPHYLPFVHFTRRARLYMRRAAGSVCPILKISFDEREAYKQLCFYVTEWPQVPLNVQSSKIDIGLWMASGIEGINAQLHRSDVRQGAKVEHELGELVGEGTLKKMVRAALTDPDDELWRYSITAGGRVYLGEEIRRLGCASEPGSVSRARGESPSRTSRF